MKALAIVGTMRKHGDSYRIIKRLEESLRREANVEVEYLFLSEHDFGFCRGCSACFERGEQYCPKRKLTGPIEEALVRADGVILASPVYDHQVTALMKNFLDHFAYFYHRPRFFGKPAIIVSPTGGSGLKETTGYLRFTAQGWGYAPVATLGVMSGLYREKDSYRTAIDADIDRAARLFIAQATSHAVKKPGFIDQVFFRGMRLKAEWNPCDRVFWEERGWLRSNYYVKTPLNPLSLLAAKAVEALMRGQMNAMMSLEKKSDGGAVAAPSA